MNAPPPQRSARERPVDLIFLPPIDVVFERRLLLAPDEAVADQERVHLGPAQTAIRLLGPADNRLAPHIEGGIDDDRATRQIAKGRNQIIVARMILAP